MNNNRKNNGFTHNVLFYAVIFLCIMGIVYFFFGGNNNSGQSKNVSQTQFVTALQKNQVKSFQVQPNGGVYKVTGTYRKPQKMSSGNQTGLSLMNQKASTTTSFKSSVLQSDVTVNQLQRYADKNDVKITTRELISHWIANRHHDFILLHDDGAGWSRWWPWSYELRQDQGQAIQLQGQQGSLLRCCW